jgi:transcription elongation factor Elf1
MTVYFTCPYCGHGGNLRLEGASRTPDQKTVAWYVISCTRCEMVFEVDWKRYEEHEKKIFPNTFHLRQESGIWEGVP